MTSHDEFDFNKLSRINVVGTTGVGKTTLSKKISILLNIPFIEIDQIFWGPDWKKPTNREFYDNFKFILETHEQWVLDGNYTKTNDLKWKNCETVIWIHFSITRTLVQLLKRTFIRLITQKELWPNTNNKESLYGHLFTNDSIFYWFFKTFRGNEIIFKKNMSDPKWKHIQFIELKSPSEVDQFLQKLTAFFNKK